MSSMSAPKLDILAKELESMHDDSLAGLIKKCRNDDYPREFLIRDLKEANLGFFAEKVAYGYYELKIGANNAETDH